MFELDERTTERLISTLRDAPMRVDVRSLPRAVQERLDRGESVQLSVPITDDGQVETVEVWKASDGSYRCQAQ